MGFSKETIKQIRRLMIFGAVLVLLLMYSEKAFETVDFFFRIARPFLYGGVTAFVLNLPMRGIEEGLLKGWKGRAAKKLKRPVSMLLAIAAVVLVIALVVYTILPQIYETAATLGREIPVFFGNMLVELEKLSQSYPELKDPVAALEDMEINWESVADGIIGFLKNGVGNVLTSTVNVAGSIVSGIVNGVISFIFALYILAQKEKLKDQGIRILTAYFPVKAKERILQVCGLLYKNFSNFITGQCLEAVILGTMFVIAMKIFRMPYAVMVGVLIAFMALIPIVGAFIGCVTGAFLILIQNPVLAFWFVIMFLVLQQIEGNLIYPKVVGSSVGLPSIWVLAAVSLGGSMFGVAGILFFIPLTATVYALFRDSVNKRNAGQRGAVVRQEPPEKRDKSSRDRAEEAGRSRAQQVNRKSQRGRQLPEGAETQNGKK